MVSTADDMAKFMLAHLQDGCYQGVCILEPETIDVMHQRQADTPYEGQAVTYGFTEGIKNNQRLIGHSGSIRGFGNNLALLPEHHLGYFFSLTPNASTRMHARSYQPSVKPSWMNSSHLVYGNYSGNCLLSIHPA